MTEIIDEIVVKLTADTKEIRGLLEEVEYLRFFYSEVDSALGPASDDIYEMIKEAYVEEGGKLPTGYGDYE